MPYENLDKVTTEYQKKSQSLGGTDAWIFKTKRIPDNEYITRLDWIISTMPPEEASKLSAKFGGIIPGSAKEWRDHYDDRFRDGLPEILGWGCLSYTFPDCKVKFSGTPDLLAINEFGKTVAGMECKKIWESEEEREWWREHNQKSGTIITDPLSDDPDKNPLLRKLRDTLTKSEAQVNKIGVESHKFLFLAVSLDLEVWLLGEPVRSLFKKEEESLKKRGITFIALRNSVEPMTESATDCGFSS